MPPNDFLSNLEWHALSQNGQIRQTIDAQRREIALLKAERDTLKADNSRLRSENQLLRNGRPPIAVSPSQVVAPAAPAQPAVEPEKTAEVEDDTAVRFGLLELD